MKRIVCLIALMALSSPASARDPYFSFHGQRIHISALRHCRSLSCVRLAVPELAWRRDRDRDADVDTAPDAAPTPAPAPVQAPPAAAPAQPRPMPQVMAQVAPTGTRTPATVPQPAPTLSTAADPQIARPASKETTASTPGAPPPAVGFEAAKPQPGVLAQGTPKAAPQLARADEGDDDPADTPLGDWQSEGRNGLVRIEACGAALCGYALNDSTHEKGEIILVNMKPKSDIWSGNIYSRSSGNSYYGTITMKEPNTLRVEACGLGRFFCSGNNWTRLEHGGPMRQHATSRAPSNRS